MLDIKFPKVGYNGPSSTFLVSLNLVKWRGRLSYVGPLEIFFQFGRSHKLGGYSCSASGLWSETILRERHMRTFSYEGISRRDWQQHGHGWCEIVSPSQWTSLFFRSFIFTLGRVYDVLVYGPSAWQVRMHVSVSRTVIWCLVNTRSYLFNGIPPF